MPTKPETDTSTVLVRARDLEVSFALRGGSLARLTGRSSGEVRAVDKVNLELRKGEVLGVIGESGSGKTTLGRAMLGLVRPTGGSLMYRDMELSDMKEARLRALRTQMQMVFQDPNAALNPSMTVETAVGHPLQVHRLASGKQLRSRVTAALERVGLSPVERFMTKYPSDLSGGQKQRVVLARATILEPSLLVADEPISMLDMSVRAKILQLMLDLRTEMDLTYVYITHDLASAKFFCDRVAIMYLGRIVEIGDTAQVFADPKHPYTRALLAAIPDPDPDRQMAKELLRGEIPDAVRPPAGCSFHPRCPLAFEICGWEARDLVAELESHWLKAGVGAYDAERSKIGNLHELMDETGDARLRPGSGSTTADLVELLEGMRREHPEANFWSGVTGIHDTGEHVVVAFHSHQDPLLRPAGSQQAACLLY
jgi:peptide/nickel transport system ATP-binding protein